ncbi:hypothetical protein D9M69_362710 [compost metagenome]
MQIATNDNAHHFIGGVEWHSEVERFREGLCLIRIVDHLRGDAGGVHLTNVQETEQAYVSGLRPAERNGTVLDVRTIIIRVDPMHVPIHGGQTVLTYVGVVGVIAPQPDVGLVIVVGVVKRRSRRDADVKSEAGLPRIP